MKLLTTLVLALTSACATAGTLELAPNTLYIAGVINQQMPDLADQLLATAATQPVVDIVINSPGGSVMYGFMFINAMDLARARGTVVRCTVTNFAASMAFQLLAHCSERYALRYAQLLWHPVRMSGQITLTPALAVVLAEDLRRVESTLVDDLRSAFKTSDKDFWYHYTQESLLTTDEVLAVAPGYLTVLDDVTGLQAVHQIAPFNPFGGEVTGVWYQWFPAGAE